MTESTDHAAEQVIPGEPEGGWMTAPTLKDADILQIVLCRFTGEMPLLSGHDVETCQARVLGRHPNLECLTIYYSADALARGEITLEMPAALVTARDGGDPNFVEPYEETEADDANT